MNKVLIFSAPSGSGKTTIVKRLLEDRRDLEFSISATSRPPRGGEKDGRDYYFMSAEEFRNRVDNDEFLEWEEVYSETCYGTLKAEIKRIWDRGHVAVFDIDVVGGLNLKKLFDGNALSVFIMPPSKEILHQRLLARGTDDPLSIKKRTDKAAAEMEFAPRFDAIVINDKLEDAIAEVEDLVSKFLER